MRVTVAENTIYNMGDPNIVYYLGQFQVVNHGGAASAEKTVKFTYNNNDKIGVTAQRIPATTGNPVEVWYTTTQNAERKYDGTLTSEGGYVTFTAKMAGLGTNEYFTKIRANVGSYERDYVSYVASRAKDPTSGYGATFGKLLTKETKSYAGFAAMTMYNTGSTSSGDPLKYTVTVTSKKGEIPPGMEQAYEEGSLKRLPILSKTSAEAGDKITFNGLLSTSAYPYSSNNIMTDPVIYIRLPKKITVENLKLYSEAGRMADKVFLFDAVTETVEKPVREEISNISLPEPTKSGDYNLYEIPLTGQKVGWFTDGLGQYQIGISFDMEIARDAEAMTLDMRDCVRFKSATLSATTNNGTLSQYQVKDTYDMDQDNVTEELFSTFNVNAEGIKLSVVAARLGLTFTFGARAVVKGAEVSDEPGDYSNFGKEGNKVYLQDDAHVVDMLFTLKNDTRRVFDEKDAQAFYYFIPVPKEGDFWDSHMQNKAFEFDMELTGEPKLSGNSTERFDANGNKYSNIQVVYSTTVQAGVGADDPRHYSHIGNYVTADKITKWSQVKMIRISATPETKSIPEDAELKVNLRLQPGFKSNADLVGSVVNFGPCGVSPYSVGAILNQGHNPLPRIQVEFQTGVIEGNVFLDTDFDGIYTEDKDRLYTDKKVTVYAPHWDGAAETTPDGSMPNHTTETVGGKYKFAGRMADTYHVIVYNPGSPDAKGESPLRFSLPNDSAFEESTDQKSATATVTLEKDAGRATLNIGLQQPHTVTFTVGNKAQKTNVWHGETLGNCIPSVEHQDGFIGWKIGETTYANTEDGLRTLRNMRVEKDLTVTAVLQHFYTLTYDGNGGIIQDTVPEVSKHEKGDKVTLTIKPTHSAVDGKSVLFIGWTENRAGGVLRKGDDAPETVTEITFADADITVYAAWGYDENGNGTADALETYLLTYDLNGGKVPEGVTYEQESVKYGVAHSLKPGPWRDGYSFTGWMDEGGNLYQAGQEMILSTDVKLMAQWCEASFENLPSTGDRSHPALWLMLLGASCVAILLAALGRKKA